MLPVAVGGSMLQVRSWPDKASVVPQASRMLPPLAGETRHHGVPTGQKYAAGSLTT